ncbi:MAG: peptidylprolyl isomerase [Fimbriiglobus sp.]
MRSLTRRAAAILAGATLAAGSLAAQTPPAAPPPSLPAPAPVKPEPRPTGVAAAINGQEIPEVAVWRALRQFPPTEHAVARKEILNHLVENMLIDQYLTALKITVEPPEVDKLVDELKGELKKGQKDYTKELEAMMLTEAEFRAEVGSQMKWDKFLKVQGTDPALKGFYDQRPDIFDGTLVRARHVLLTPGNDPAKQAEAEKTLQGIKAGVAQKAAEAEAAATGDALAKAQAKGKKSEEIFAEYAKQYSQCPSKRDGGDLQFFPRVGAMVEPFAEAAFKLNVYDLSDVVKTEFGYHLILCTAKNTGKPRKFDDVKEDVRAVFAMRLRDAVIGQMKPRAQINYTAPAAAAAPAPAK